MISRVSFLFLIKYTCTCNHVSLISVQEQLPKLDRTDEYMHIFADPCTVSTMIPHIELRSPTNYKHSKKINEFKTGWYDSTNTTSILTRPVTFGACGNLYPMWVKGSYIIFDVIMLQTRVRLRSSLCTFVRIRVRIGTQQPSLPHEAT